jgi:Kdo2-lipid IVA lauroyltransferase/acyltransferase
MATHGSGEPPGRQGERCEGGERGEYDSPHPIEAAQPSDLRLGGSWTTRQRVKNDALWAIASLALGIVRGLRLGLPTLRLLGRALGVSAYALARGPRRIALANVARVFAGLDAGRRDALVRRCFATLGECLGESIALLDPRSAPPPIPLSDGARALFEQARREGRGVVFASAHLGPWERVAASLVAAGVPLVTVARESYDPRFSRLYDRLRSSSGVRVVWRGRPGAAARMVRTLRAGGILGIPMDLKTRVASIEAPFLGHAAPTPVGPARLALRTGAAVIVGTAAPAPRRNAPRMAGEQTSLEVTATRIATGDLPPGVAGVRVLTERLNAELSQRILAFAHGWVWMHDRWRPRTSGMMFE